jgi:hypothetical protein
MPITMPAPEQVALRPETFRLPRPGRQDQYFGFSRSFYYNAEDRGLLELIRVIAPGRSRGVTLVRYADVLSLVNAAKAEKK